MDATTKTLDFMAQTVEVIKHVKKLSQNYWKKDCRNILKTSGRKNKTMALDLSLN